MTIGKRIREIRINMHLTQDELSEKTGLNKSTLSRIERGLISPKWDTIIRISRAFNIGTDKLLQPLESAEYQFFRDEANAFYRYEYINILLAKIRYYFPLYIFDQNILSEILTNKPYEILRHLSSTCPDSLDRTSDSFAIELQYIDHPDREIFTWNRLLNLLNIAGINLLDFISESILESPPDDSSEYMRPLYFLDSQFAPLLDNIFLKCRIDNVFKSFRDIINRPNTPSTIVEIIDDQKTMTIMNITLDEMSWLIRIPPPPGFQFTKQDYLDMLYIYRNTQRNFQDDNKEGE